MYCRCKQVFQMKVSVRKERGNKKFEVGMDICGERGGGAGKLGERGVNAKRAIKRSVED